MSQNLRRREFLRNTSAAGLAAGTSVFFGERLARAADKPESANEKLNIAVIGTANRAAGNIEGVESQNIVAICDIDDRLLARTMKRFPGSRGYNDFRKMLEMQKNIDAVVVSTADHIHAPASVMAMKRGKHVYCEKPLSHSVYEARVVAETAAEAKVATQMGTQIHAVDNYRRVVELIQAGAIGPVRECHVWVGKFWGGGERPTETVAIPRTLHWDLWLGPAPARPYHPTYQPANWRRWWDFGSGTLGDMACHYMDLPFWALGLRSPTSAEAEGPPVHAETAPEWLIVRYEFPARGDQPPVKLSWSDGGKRPSMLKEIPAAARFGDGVLFVGDKGMLLADYNRRVLLPEAEFKEYKAPEPTIPKSIGHHLEWIEACKDGRPTTCNFSYSGALSEAVLLGTVAYRTGKKLDWDAENLKATNCPEASKYVRREYRKGWTL